MVDQTIFTSDPLQQPIDVDHLKKVDINTLNQNGIPKVLEFLTELKQGIDQGRPEIRLNIPFIENEAQSQNEYYLYLNPQVADRSGLKKVLSLADAINILDELVEWTNSNPEYHDQSVVKDTVSALGASILRSQQTITENWLSAEAQIRRFTLQVDHVLHLFTALSEDETPEFENLETLLEAIEKASPAELLTLWQDPKPEIQPVRELIEQFGQLDLGKMMLTGKTQLPAHQVRKLANAFGSRIQQLAHSTWNQEIPAELLSTIQLLDSGNLTFDLSDPLAPKTKFEDDQIGALLQTFDTLVPALRNPKKEEKPESSQSTGGSQNQSPAETDTTGGSEDQAENQRETPSSSARVIPPELESLRSNPNFSQVNQYYWTSIQAGFLYNHITSNIYTLYGLPFDLSETQLALPPLIEYQLRQEITRKLYGLDAYQMERFDRFRLGEELFRSLILANPKLFVAIEHHLQETSQKLNLPITEVDPLHLEDRTQAFERDQFVNSIAQQTDQLDDRADVSFQELKKAIDEAPPSHSFAQSDAEFIQGLMALGIDAVEAENTRLLVLAYIQTTGLDMEALLFNPNVSDVRTLFAGVNLKPKNGGELTAEDINAFRLLVISYSQFQAQKLQQISNRRLVPDKRIAELAATGLLPIYSDDMVKIIKTSRETAVSVRAEGRDSRHYILASLSSAQDLDPSSSQYQILASSLKDLSESQGVPLEETLQSIARINAIQQRELKNEIAQFEYKRFVAFQSRVQETQEPVETDLVGPIGLAAFQAMDLRQKQSLIQQLIATDPTLAPQDIFDKSSGYSDVDSSFLDEAETDSSEPLGQDQTEASGARGSIFGAIKQRYDNLTTRGAQAKKAADRLKTLGKTASQAKTATSAAAAPTGTLTSRVVGGLAKAVLGNKIGGRIQNAVQTAGLIKATVGGLVWVGTTLLGLLGPLLPIIAGGLGVFAALDFLKNTLFGSSGGSVVSAQEALAAQAGTTPLATPDGTAPGAPTGVTATATAAAPISTGTLAAGTAIASTAIISTVMAMSTQSAFLTALPTVGEQFISPYVEIEKVAVQGNAFDAPTDITYELRIRARQGYQIKLTQAPTDTFSVTFTQRAGEPPRPATSTVPASSEYDAFQAGLATFHTDNPVITNEYVPIGRYTIPFGSNPGSIDYTDANVSNIFRITFTVLDESGQPVPEQLDETVASTGEVICFGECPQAQGGCWPMSGTIGQEPYGSFTHAVSSLEQDAYDIMGPIGTPVYAPFVGRACQGHIDPRYGYHVTMEVPNMSYNGQPGTVYLIFAHLDSVSPQLNAGCFDVTSEMLRSGGFELGRSGNTGNSSGPHLHYEARWNTLDVSGKSHPSLIEQLVPTKAVYPDPVRSCYDQ